MTSRTATRDQIIEAADQLFYTQGFDHTSFANIAEIVKISRGNFYYHFKTKDEILDAVIGFRLENTQAMLDQWEIAGNTPEERIRSFIHILNRNSDKIRQYGCPVGTLSTELAKLNHGSHKESSRIFTLFRTWLQRQFSLMGHTEKSDDLAMHLLARSQGVATMASAFNDDNFIKKEVSEMCNWLDNIDK